MRLVWDDRDSDSDTGTICVTDTPTSEIADVCDSPEESPQRTSATPSNAELAPVEESISSTPTSEDKIGSVIGLCLHNFKSYGGTVHISEFSNFTAIIGPNGCGKSNLMDAISFVLCVSSTVLRGLDLKDLIYKSRGKGSDPVTEAYVELTLNGGPKPVLFRRQISISGNVSYFVDGASISFKQYKESLREYRINTLGSTGLIFQGAVNDIAARSPAELTRLFETISGSSLYAKPYKYIKEKLERRRMEYRNLVARKRSLQQELRQYRSMISNNVDYDALLSSYKRAEARKYAYDFHRISLVFRDKKLEYDRLSQRASELNELLSNMQTKRAELEHERSTLYFEQSQLHRLIQDKQKRLLSKKESMSHYYESRSRLEKRLSELDALRQSVESDVDSLQRESEELSEQESRLHCECESITAELQSLRSSAISLTAAQREKYDGLLQSFVRATSALRIKLNLGRGKIADLSSDGDHIRGELESLRKYHGKLMESSKPHESMYQNLCTRLRETNDSIELLSMTKSRLEHERSQVTSRRSALQDEKSSLDNHLKTLNVAKLEYRQIVRRRQYTQELMTAIEGVHGEVFSLCEITNACYHDSIMAALNTRGQMIVTDSMSVIQECISKLRRDRVFKRDFIPLDSLKLSKSDNRARLSELFRSRGIRVHYKLAVDCLVFQRRYGSLFEHLLGDTVLVDSLEDAERLISCDSGHYLGFTVVTQKGQVITRDRTIILDSAVYTKNTQLEIELAEFSRLSLKSERLDQDIQLLSKKLTGIEGSLQDTIGKLQKHHRAKELLQMKVDFARRHKEASEQQLESSESKILAVSKRLSDIESEIKVLEESQSHDESVLCDLQRSHFKELNDELGVDDVHGLLNSNQDSAVRLESTLEHKRALLHRCARDKCELSNRLEHLREQSLSDLHVKHERCLVELRALLQTNESLHRELTELENDLASDRERFDRLSQEIEKCHERMKYIQYDHDYGLDCPSVDITQDSDSQSGRVVPLRESKETVSLELLALMGSIRELQRSAIELADNCRLRNVDCRISVPTSLCDPSSDFVCEFPELVDSGLIDPEMDVDRAISRLDSEMSSLRKSLSTSGARDDVEARLRRTQVDIDHLDAEISSAKSECSNLEPDFERIKKERTSLFMNCFNGVKRLVGPIYRSLSARDDSDDTTGGSAFLTLDDDVSGSISEPFLCSIRYNTMPPMKKFLDLSLQSGGEKAVSSLALLLALHSFRRSPFVVLDEIDANLDNVKVCNLVSFLRRSDFQTIIISLKPRLFSSAEVLVGVYTCHEKASSSCVVLNLAEYGGDEVTNGVISGY
ncbi:Structural maintenance of chromosomes protein 1 [Babesia sp. Xinjiang]|uniref:Structural maintenance of chromosomes protein 1 n=1 Tax=Babesia sp. Xinjiang TaxID=462227 RepID=UPI000A2270A1|nr:Structural maintenance of chromosomes protein 1 [Babesia sp. Xinjiang]ORM39784.1 Structural maintenance of chromosomes protein 1 [Babesia sp. Xinjiang]